MVRTVQDDDDGNGDNGDDDETGANEGATIEEGECESIGVTKDGDGLAIVLLLLAVLLLCDGEQAPVKQ